MHKLASKLITAVFLVILFIPLVSWLFFDNNQKIHSSEEQRNFAIFPSIKCASSKTNINKLSIDAISKNKCINRFITQKFQTQVEAAVSDRFPFRPRIIEISKFFERNLIEVAYFLQKDPAIPADFNSGIYVLRDKSRLLDRPVEFNELSKELTDRRIQNYSELIKANPDINFYAFYIQRIQDSSYHPLNDYFPESDEGQGVAYFEANLPNELTLQKNLYSGFEDYLRFSFATDHHWNMRGACDAYERVFQELAQNYTDIPERMICDQYIELEGVNFLGYYARATLYPIEPDKFEVSASTFSDYETYINGKEATIGKVTNYLAGKFDHDKYASHYGAVFGPQHDPVEYYFPGNPPRNLLLIGSSYRKPLEPFIAALYQRTYIHDMRYEKDFSLSEFLSKYQIDDVLIIGDYNVIYGDPEWIINP